MLPFSPIKLPSRGFTALLLSICMTVTPGAFSQQQPDTQPISPTAPAAPSKPATPPKDKKGKDTYTGPNTVVVLPPTPMLDAEGKQRLDPDGKPMFNTPIQQLRDKKGHPVFDENGKPVFQTANNLGYDEKGKKIVAKKEKSPKTRPLSISDGTLTVDGWTGKARLNYDIADFKFLYIYAPGIGTSIVSHGPFPGATEQAGAFNDKTLRVTVEGHTIEVASDKRLLDKKPQSAWVAVDRSFQMSSKFPVFGYGITTRSPYSWPGSKETPVAAGPVEPPPLPADLRPAPLLTPCPPGTMRPAGPPAQQEQNAPAQPCIKIPAGTPVANTTEAPATPAK